MALSIFDNLEEANDELEKIEDEIEIPHITKEEILKNYDFNFDVDSETLEFLKEQTIKVHKKGNTFYTGLGKIFRETHNIPVKEIIMLLNEYSFLKSYFLLNVFFLSNRIIQFEITVFDIKLI